MKTLIQRQRSVLKLLAPKRGQKRGKEGMGHETFCAIQTWANENAIWQKYSLTRRPHSPGTDAGRDWTRMLGMN